MFNDIRLSIEIGFTLNDNWRNLLIPVFNMVSRDKLDVDIKI